MRIWEHAQLGMCPMGQTFTTAVILHYIRVICKSAQALMLIIDVHPNSRQVIAVYNQKSYARFCDSDLLAS